APQLRAANAAARLRLSSVVTPAGVVDVPWIGTNGAHSHREVGAENRPQAICSLFAPRVFTGPMCDIDQRHIRRSAVLVSGVMTEVCRDISLHASGCHDVQQRIARASQ